MIITTVKREVSKNYLKPKSNGWSEQRTRTIIRTRIWILGFIPIYTYDNIIKE